MTFFILSFLAGVLTILAPCVLPLLPVVIGATGNEKEKRHLKTFIVIASLSVSIIVFTLLLKASTLLIDIPQGFWTGFSGTVIILLGIFTLFPNLWSAIPWVRSVHNRSNRSLGSGYKKNNFAGDIIIGASLGPVFTTCSPTYLFILATVLPASFIVGLIYLLSFTVGVALSLAVVAILGQKIVSKFTVNQARTELIKKVFGVLFILVGVAIITGYDKKISTYLLDIGVGGTVLLEERLIEQTQNNMPDNTNGTENDSTSNVPKFLERSFKDTDWTRVDPSVGKALSGGPGKDGIPAIDEPMFISITETEISDIVQSIVIVQDDIVKAYPYNILIWHEIVNDTVGGIPVAVTFCPLCGSAVVYERMLPQGETTFGVSGALIESNMVMYDRETESLFQQSTGKGIAGTYHELQLQLVKFQLLTIGEIKEKYPKALIVSTDTGYSRNYERNPYSGYTDNNDFIFTPSTIDSRYPSKTIFVAFTIDGRPVASPWLDLEDRVIYTFKVNETVLKVTKEDGELTIVDTSTGIEIPFYFEMWFSWAVQHDENGLVLVPNDSI